jgi:sugar phosphate isomerase/epimerase
LSTASVYPESTATAFELARRLGYEAVEVMVGLDPVSQDVDAIKHLIEYHQIPVRAVHAPCLLITQRVWGTDPWDKLVRSGEMATALDAEVVVVHPPFRWQREYARTFERRVSEFEAETGLGLCVENMFPWRASGRALQAYAPGWNPLDQDYANVTLDVSHTATAGVDVLEMAIALGDRLRHLHLADGTPNAKDEHLVPGKGTQPCADLLEFLAGIGYSGCIVIEINTRKAANRAQREASLAEALAFTRLAFAAPTPTPSGRSTTVRKTRQG